MATPPLLCPQTAPPPSALLYRSEGGSLQELELQTVEGSWGEEACSLYRRTKSVLFSVLFGDTVIWGSSKDRHVPIGWRGCALVLKLTNKKAEKQLNWESAPCCKCSTRIRLHDTRFSPNPASVACTRFVCVTLLKLQRLHWSPSFLNIHTFCRSMTQTRPEPSTPTPFLQSDPSCRLPRL